MNFPARPNAPRVVVDVELGPWPNATGACTPWKTSYTVQDTLRQVKDYQLCRAEGAGQYVIDEGGGTRLTATLLGGVLHSAFKVGSQLLLTQLRLRGDTLEEEILSVPDAPATAGLVTMPVTNVQLLRLTRVH